ncbi:unnamed protein product, partial [Amoebophrya sp. A25]|eukprot:GSA25T00014392001.1
MNCCDNAGQKLLLQERACRAWNHRSRELAVFQDVQQLQMELRICDALVQYLTSVEAQYLGGLLDGLCNAAADQVKELLSASAWSASPEGKGKKTPEDENSKRSTSFSDAVVAADEKNTGKRAVAETFERLFGPTGTKVAVAMRKMEEKIEDGAATLD